MSTNGRTSAAHFVGCVQAVIHGWLQSFARMWFLSNRRRRMYDTNSSAGRRLPYDLVRDVIGYGLGFVTRYETREHLDPGVVLEEVTSKDDADKARELLQSIFHDLPCQALSGAPLQKYCDVLEDLNGNHRDRALACSRMKEVLPPQWPDGPNAPPGVDG